jgi:hypothetical protein
LGDTGGATAGHFLRSSLLGALTILSSDRLDVPRSTHSKSLQGALARPRGGRRASTVKQANVMTGAPSPYTGPERRRAPRAGCALPRLLTVLIEHAPVTEVVAAVNASPYGLGLYVQRSVRVGGSIFLSCPEAPAGSPPRTARVVHIQEPHNGAVLLIGCEFTEPLTEDQLRALLESGAGPRW